MTSKNLFFKVMKNDLSRRLWNIAISFLGFFVMLPLLSTMELSNLQQQVASGELSREKLITTYATIISGNGNEMIVLLTMFLSIFLAFTGFAYLYSKSKVDLFHSVAIKRVDMFKMLYINGVIIYFIPYIFNLALYFIIGGFNGLITTYTFKLAAVAMLNNVVHFILIYNVAILAIVMTGNTVVGGLGTLVFCFYGSYVLVAKEGVFDAYFNTYYGGRGIGEGVLSPIVSYIYSLMNIRNDYFASAFIRMAIVLAIAIILLAICIILYVKRPSEGCTRAMAFNITKAPIRILITLPAAILGGILFVSTVSNKSVGWLIFGVIFVAIIVHGVIEVIFNSDFKSFFNAKIQLLAVIVITLFISVGAKYDWFGYDSYVPDREDISEIYMDFANIDNGIGYYKEDGQYLHYDSEYKIENISIEDLDAAYSIASECAKNHNLTDGKYLGNINIKYVLKNGKEVYRAYRSVSYENIDEALTKIYDSEDYKNDAFPIMTRDEATVYSVEVYLPNKDYLTTLALDDRQKTEFLEAFKKDVYNSSLETVKKNTPITCINFKWKNSFNNEMSDGQYYIYPDYANTLALIENYCGVYEVLLDKMDITSVVIDDCNYKGETGLEIENYASEILYEEEYNQATYTITDRNAINQLKDCWIRDSLNDSNVYRDSSYEIYISINYITDGGREETMTGTVSKVNSPEWIKELFND